MRGHVVVVSALSSLLIVACGSPSKGRTDASVGSDSLPDDSQLPGDGADDAPIDSEMDDAPPDMMMPASTQVLRINEVNANATNCDLVELRAIAGGELTGLRLVEREDIVFTFPAMTVAPGALIVVHFGAGASGPCSNGISDNETASPTQFPNATYPGNYDGAYDLFTTDASLTATNNVISVMRTTTVIDGVLLASGATGESAGDSEDQAAVLVAQSQWQMVGGGTPTGGFIDDNFSAHAALDLDAGGTTPAGVSIQRLDNTDDNDKADWNNATVTVQPSTWGALNLGQSPL
jgi:hypothetical protein